MQKSLKEEQLVPEDQRLTSQARIQYGKVRIYVLKYLFAFAIVRHWFVLVYALSYMFDFESEFECQNWIEFETKAYIKFT